jgi:hypothetical protein
MAVIKVENFTDSSKRPGVLCCWSGKLPGFENGSGGSVGEHSLYICFESRARVGSHFFQVINLSFSCSKEILYHLINFKTDFLGYEHLILSDQNFDLCRGFLLFKCRFCVSLIGNDREILSCYHFLFCYFN